MSDSRDRNSTDSRSVDSEQTLSEGTETLGSRTLAPAKGRVELRRGDSLGRYLVLEPVGRGGMGEVYAAYDPKLDRKIALKVLTVADHGEAARARLIREARALARLNHPNVVALYDADWADGRMFITTEFIVGETFNSWLVSKDRRRREILRVLTLAGRGLAAAHDAGLVHRDVKGSNIMVAEDGRVLMLDFGLARASREGDDGGLEVDQAAASPTSEIGTSESGSSGGDLSESRNSGGLGAEREPEVSPTPFDPLITCPGAVLGTPAFMAPEQRQGQSVGPAADQYSFCAVVFQALTGTLPAVDKEGAAAATLPPRLRRLLGQGLAEKPTDRHSSMAQVLKLLDRETGRTRRQLTWASALVVLFVLGFFAWSSRAQKQLRCASGAQLFAKVWNKESRAELESTLLVGSPQAAVSGPWQSVVEGLGRYGETWTSMYREACEATHLRGRQSVELLDLRIDCLDRRLSELSAGLEALTAEGRDLSAASGLVSRLTPVSQCAEIRALRSPTSPPEDAAGRRQLAELRRQLTAVKATWLVGDYSDAHAAAEALEQPVADFGYWPLIAEVRLERARIQESRGEPDEADRLLVETLLAAHAGGHSRVAAQALIRRVRVLGFQLRRFADAEDATKQADGAVKRLDETTSLAAELQEIRGLLEVQQGRYEEAKKLLEPALAAKEALLGRNHLNLAPTLSRLGEVAFEQGRLAEAEILFRRALVIDEAHLGPDHPNVANVRSQLAYIARDSGNFDTARGHLEKALEIRRQSLGPDHLQVAVAVADLASTYSGLGELELAESFFKQAIELFVARLGDDHPYVAITVSNMAVIYLRQEEPGRAIPLYHRALEIQRNTYGDEHPGNAQMLLNLGTALRRAGQPTKAIPRLEQAAEIWLSGDEQQQILAADAWLALGEAYLDLGQPKIASSWLEQAAEKRRGSSRRPDLQALNSFALARALEAEGREPERRMDLAREALDQFRQLAPGRSRELEKVEAWIEQQSQH